MRGLSFEAPEAVDVEGPLIFLAGPIQGAPPWHDDAVAAIRVLDERINIASPRRHTERRGEFTQDMYNEQVDWETRYLNRASEKGVILFWLAKEAHHVCRRAYAQTSRFELAEWKERHKSWDVRLVVGIEDGFTGARYIRRRLAQDCPNVQILDSLEATCFAAVNLARGK